MALLLQTNLGDLVIDLDTKGSPELCSNVLKLAKARYFSQTLVYNVDPLRFCQLGDPRGDGTGGACIYGLLNDSNNDVTKSKTRFLKSQGRILTRQECQERGRVVATIMNGINDTIGSQFLITLEQGQGRALDGYIPPHDNNTNDSSSSPEYLSLGIVTEDEQDVLSKIHDAYCDANGRPYADIRIERALVIHDPFPDPPGMQELLQKRGVVMNSNNVGDNVTASPVYERPPEEVVEIRISANQVDAQEDDEQDDEHARQRQEEIAKKEDKSRAVVLEMLGDLPSADIKAPENVLFVCKLNSITEDEDLELIFSRFDPNVKVEIIRDFETGASLQYAFLEFSTKKQCVQAYFKMDGALIDDRRIKVDFSQSVAKIWDRYNKKMKPTRLQEGNVQRGGGGRGRGGGGRGGFHSGGGRGRGGDGNQYRRDGRDRGGPPSMQDRGRFDRPPPRRDGHYDDDRNRENQGRYRDDHHGRYGDSSRDRYDEYRGERRHHREDYSPPREYDDFGRQRRSRSPSPDVERSRDHKRRKHSRKRDRHERSHRDDGDYRRRGSEDSRSPRRYDSDDGDRNGSSRREEGDESRHSRRDQDEGRSRSHRDIHEDERRHRKKHHHRHHRDRDDRDERRRHKKRKHKEKRRRSRSRSASYDDK